MVACTFLSHSMLSPLTPLLALQLGAGPIGVGLLVSAAFFLPLFLAMPVGALADSWGTRELILWGCAMMGLGPMGVALAPNFVTLSISQLLTGMGHLMIIVSAQTYVGSLGRGKAGEGNFGWYSTFIAAGALAGPLLGGVTSDHFGFRVAYLLAGISALLAILLGGFLGPRQGTRTAMSSLAPFGSPGQIRRLLGNSAVRVSMVVSCGVLFAMGSYGAFLPVYLNTLAYPATLIGLLLSIRALAAMVVRPFMGKIVQGLGGRMGTFLVTTTLVGAGVAFTGFAETLPLLFILIVAVGAGTGITQPISMVTVADHVSGGERGFAMGLRMTGNRVVQLLSPLILGGVAEFFGFRAAFLVAGSGLLATLFLIARWGHASELEEEAA